MEKTKLTRFIEKYHLSGNVNAVVINSNNSKLSTRFITGDKALLGELSCNDFTFEDTELGVYDTEQLSKLLSVLSEEVSYNVSKSGHKAIALEVTASLVASALEAFIAASISFAAAAAESSPL